MDQNESGQRAHKRLLAPAKINLSLHIAGKRSDGYHELSGLVAFAKLGDSLSFEGRLAPHKTKTDASLQLALTGPFGHELTSASSDDDNLVLKAVRHYEQRSGLALSGRLLLTKNLPIASGIGGGSSDAAGALNLLQSLAVKPLDDKSLRAIAVSLGADVPMCLNPQAQWISGLGEQCQTIANFPALACVLVNPLVKVPTGEIFRILEAPALAMDYEARPPEIFNFTRRAVLFEWLMQQRNDLQAPAIRTAPIIDHVLEVIDSNAHCILARMSGSGATCFGLYDNIADAKQAAKLIILDHSNWWVRATTLN